MLAVLSTYAALALCRLKKASIEYNFNWESSLPIKFNWESSSRVRIYSSSYEKLLGNYFSKKEVGDLDIELPVGCGDEGYLSTLQYWLNEIEKYSFDDNVEGRKQFDFIFFQAGKSAFVLF